MSATQASWQEICRAVQHPSGNRCSWRPDAQIALVRALLAEMGGERGKAPNLTHLAARMGIRRQTLLQLLGKLEAKGVVVRSLEIRIRR